MELAMEEYLPLYHKNDIIDMMNSAEESSLTSVYVDLAQLSQTSPNLFHDVVSAVHIQSLKWTHCLLEQQKMYAELYAFLDQSYQIKTNSWVRFVNLPELDPRIRSTYPTNHDIGDFVQIKVSTDFSIAFIDLSDIPEGDLPVENTGELIDDSDFRDSRVIALKIAERLLTDLRIRPGGLDNEALHQRLLKNFIDLAYRSKNSIESALFSFTKIASQEEYKKHPGPILGMATAHILLKQSQKARNLLKRVTKHAWSFENAEYLDVDVESMRSIFLYLNETLRSRQTNN